MLKKGYGAGSGSMTRVNEERGAENTEEEKQMEGNSEGGAIVRRQRQIKTGITREGERGQSEKRH